MPIDASIPLQVQQPKLEDPTNALMRVLQIQGMQDARQKEQRALDQQDALNSAYGGALGPDGKLDENKLYSLLSGRGQGSQIPGVQKSLADVANTRAQTDQRAAAATKDTSEAENKTISIYRDASQSITDPQSAINFVTHMHSDPRLANSAIARIPLEQAIAQIPQDPSQLGAWKQQFALGATKFMELNKPTTNVVNTGGTTQMVQTPGLGGAPTVAQTFNNTQDPNSVASVGATMRGQDMTNARAKEQLAQTARLHADTMAHEDLRAGVGPGGALDANTERTAQAIASGQLPAPTGMALLNPKNQRILGRVMEINPQYDSTTVAAKKAAAVAFTSGSQGNAMRSFQVAGQHLDQLGQLVDGLNNGNLQIVNKIGNMYATQTGSPAPTNFDAAKDVVSKEVVKAIVAGGGGQAERQELSNLMSQAKSPAQLKGVIQQYRNLMAAQHDALLQQRRAAGLSDSTLPNYSEAGGGGTAGTALPPDIASILQKHGGK